MRTSRFSTSTSSTKPNCSARSEIPVCCFASSEAARGWGNRRFSARSRMRGAFAMSVGPTGLMTVSSQRPDLRGDVAARVARLQQDAARKLVWLFVDDIDSAYIRTDRQGMRQECRLTGGFTNFRTVGRVGQLTCANWPAPWPRGREPTRLGGDTSPPSWRSLEKLVLKISCVNTAVSVLKWRSSFRPSSSSQSR